jgi:subtilisin family serine protease
MQIGRKSNFTGKEIPMLSGMGKANWGRFFWVILSLMVCDSWGFDAFGQNSGARAVPDSNHPSLINEDSDKVDYFLRKKLNTRSLRFTEWREEVRFASSADSKVINATDSGDKIQVYIEVDSVDSDVKSILESYGATVEIINKNLKTIQAWIPESQVYQIAQLPFVKRMRNPAYAVFRNSSNSPAQRSLRSGSVTTEGDAILNADEVRARGVSGTGAKVGVITDGVTNRGTAVASGDLPLNITILAETAMGGDEGTALLEIVYDIAPGAELAFCGVLTSLDMIKCVNDLANVFAADIIVDDAAFFNEPYFEDGPVAQAVKNILPNRVYVAAAGNESKQHYTANFQGTNTLGITRNGLPANEHNFGLASGGGSSDPTLDVTLEPGESLSVFLQWNDPFGESSNDYDLYVYNASNEIIGRSEAIQDGDDDPFEELKGWINNTGSRQTYKIAVTKFSGEDKQIKLFIWAPAVLSEYAVSAGSIFGHPAVSGVLATAAIHADDPGNDTISDTCSQGPVEIFFPSRETRQKPDVTAIDCVSITGAGGFPVPFCGTSAAAPHVAGVAALLVGGSASPDEVSQVIMSTAVDLGSAGFDNIFGYGRVDAFSAAQELNLLSSSPQAKPPQPENDNGKGSGTCFISTVW